LAGALLASAPSVALGQTPPPTQVQQLIQQNAPTVIQRIRQSGLSADQIRAKLAQYGYPTNMLDSYISQAFGATPEGGPLPTLSDSALHALDQLAPLAIPQAVQAVPPTTGAQPAPGANAPAPAPSAIFGTDVFRGKTSQFQPLLAGPVPSNYRVGPGDELILIITGDVEAIIDQTVTREGFLVIPQVGQLSVTGLMMDQLKALLRDRLGRTYSGIKTGSTHFDVTIAKLRTNQVFAIGEVLQPGAYQLASVATVLNALYAAGGPSDRGSFRNIAVRRGGKVIDTLDLYDYLLRGDTRSDVVLEQGDVIFVPVHGTRAIVAGAVRRPATYELSPRESLRNLIDDAGGFTANAAFERVSIARILPPSQRAAGGPDRVVVDVPLSLRDTVIIPAFPIETGDSVMVFSVPDVQHDVVELRGSVYHPGTYGFHPGMKLSALIALAGGLKPAVYTSQANITRLNPTDSTRFVVRVALPADSSRAYPNDILLNDFDIVTIFGRETFRNDRNVTIDGMVNAPGNFPYEEGMTVRDLVLRAQGLRDGAYLDTVEVSSLPLDRSHGTIATIRRLPIDSSYLAEPDSSSYKYLPGPAAPSRGSAAEIPLRPFDHVLVLKQPEFELQRTVAILGEVKYGGTYALSRKDERISDLIKRAGGLVPTAYAQGARLIRSFNKAGLVDIRLDEAIKHPGGNDDIIMQPADTVRVPEFIPTVSVQGAVNSPATVQYREGAGLDYYIQNAGGYSQIADEGRVSVRYADGSARVKSKFLIFTSSPEPGPGSTITVPVAPPQQPFNVTEFFSAVAQILTSTIAILVLSTKL
jgi:protein involved in polysaccharide export with SLBB domain